MPVARCYCAIVTPILLPHMAERVLRGPDGMRLQIDHPRPPPEPILDDDAKRFLSIAGELRREKALRERGKIDELGAHHRTGVFHARRTAPARSSRKWRILNSPATSLRPARLPVKGQAARWSAIEAWERVARACPRSSSAPLLPHSAAALRCSPPRGAPAPSFRRVIAGGFGDARLAAYPHCDHPPRDGSTARDARVRDVGPPMNDQAARQLTYMPSEKVRSATSIALTSFRWLVYPWQPAPPTEACGVREKQRRMSTVFITPAVAYAPCSG